VTAATSSLTLSVLELARALEKGALSPVALAEAALERIGQLGPRLNCFVTVTRELALAQAHAADRELRAGLRRSVVHGIPFGLKDNIDTAGIPTTWGARPYEHRVPDTDAAVVERLRSAGAVLVGKLSLIELAGGLGYASAGASVNGSCRNPWDTSRWAGGSSSGPAAAVAGGLVPFAVGTETAGSLLTPAAFCGASALRPTYGAISRHGVLPYAFTLDKVGPICRTARDCDAVAAVLVGRDRRDRTSVRAPRGLGRVDPEQAAGLRVAVIDLDRDPDPPPAGMEVYFNDALAALANAGLKLESAKLPALPWVEVLDVIIEAEAEVAFEDLLRSGRVRELSDPRHHQRSDQYQYHRTGRPSDYVKAAAVRAAMQEAMETFFTRYDLIVSGTISAVAPPVDRILPAMDIDDPSAMGNLLGLPAATVPMGLVGKERLPVGLTFIGPPMRDARVLAAAALFQSKTRWHLEKSPVSLDGAHGL
jgi:aspartyl-tRNA(Asn)/glutamyl-tRNA(Gln) amidotransferase subunit A